jgi:hypothetical protein
MVAIPFPLTSAPGKVPYEGAGRLKNVYSEALVDGARGANVWRRAPGLSAFATTGQTGFRGAIVIGPLLYAAFSGNASTVSSAGLVTSLGSIPGTKGIFWARDNAAPTPDVIAVDPDNGAFLVTPSSVTPFIPGAFPQFNSVCFQDGYFFLTTGDGRCFASGLNATTLNGETFIACEGSTGGLLRAVPFTDLYLCGPHSIEVWHDTAEPPPGFPYSRVKVIPVGLYSAYAISGFDLGFGKGIIFLGSDGVVYALNGYQPTKISTPDVDRAVQRFIATATSGTFDPSQIQMFSYLVGGHSCVVLTCPLFTWVFDVDTVRWHERFSLLSGAAAIAGPASWRAQFAINAFGQWIAGDALTGNLVSIGESAYDEVGTPLVYEVESGPMSDFPNRMAVPIATFDMAQGLGIATSSQPNVVNPEALISWSDDGGVSWSIPRAVGLGQQGVTADPIRVFKTGMTTTMGRRWKIKVSDAVPIELIGGDQFAEPRQA